MSFIITTQEIKKLGFTCWFTNLETQNDKWLELTKEYSKDDYKKYYTYDAINVDRVKDIPKNYNGAMGVPISIVTKWNPKQFRIIGMLSDTSSIKYNLASPIIGGKKIYKRLVLLTK